MNNIKDLLSKTRSVCCILYSDKSNKKILQISEYESYFLAHFDLQLFKKEIERKGEKVLGNWIVNSLFDNYKPEESDNYKIGYITHGLSHSTLHLTTADSKDITVYKGKRHTSIKVGNKFYDLLLKIKFDELKFEKI